MSLKAAALALYDAGWTVFPLAPKAKQPGVRWGDFVFRRPTRAQVEAWWTAEPRSNIALLTGVCDGVTRPLVAVDVDVKGGGNVEDARLLAGGGPRTRTQSGGRHFFYAHPGAGTKVKSCARPSPAMPGVDIRGDGGYVVAAPSLGERGSYVAEVDLLTTPLPEWGTVAGLFVTATQVGARPSLPSDGTAAGSSPVPVAQPGGWLTLALSGPVPQGGQRQTITRLAGYFQSKGLPSDVARTVIWRAVRTWPQDQARPWTPQQVSDCVNSIYVSAGGLPPESGTEPIGLRCFSAAEFLRTYEGRGVQWLVEGWLPAQSVGMVVAPPQTYKSFFLIDLALSIATGNPFLGQYPVTQPGHVLLVNAEDPAYVISERVAGLLHSKHRADRPFRTDVAFDPELLDGPNIQRLPLTISMGDGLAINAAGRGALRVEVERLKPKLVILDPLYAFAGSKNFFIEVPNFIAYLKQLRNDFGTSFLIAHHTKKVDKEYGDGGREQTWGSQLLSAASEVDWQLRRMVEGVVTIQRHFKAAGGKDKGVFSVDVDLERVPAIVLRELDEDEVADVVREKQETAKANRVKQADGLDKGRAIQAGVHAELLINIVACLSEDEARTIGDVVGVVGYAPRTVQRSLSQLMSEGRVLRTGKGKSSTYRLTKIDPKEVS